MNTIGLIFFITLHWALVLSTTTYVFVRKSTKYDMLYFTLICTIFTSWLFTGKECLISYWERLCADPTYKYASNPYKHLFLDVIFSEKYSDFVLFCISTLNVYNFYVMLDIYKVPIPIRISLFCFLLYPSIKPKIKKYFKKDTT